MRSFTLRRSAISFSNISCSPTSSSVTIVDFSPDSRVFNGCSSSILEFVIVVVVVAILPGRSVACSCSGN